MLLHDFLGLEPYNPRPTSERYRNWQRRMARHDPQAAAQREHRRQTRNQPLSDSLKSKLEKKLGKNKKL